MSSRDVSIQRNARPVRRIRVAVAIAVAAFVLVPGSAFAHTAGGALGGFASGFTHPIFGWDHLLAMLAVGIWGAQMGGRSLWTLPVVFPLVMAAGGFLGATGVPFPLVESVIALSVLGLGAAIAFALKPAEWMAIVAIGVFGLFHGHAHGTELPVAADPVVYSIGFVLATGLIHLAGIGFGLLLGSRLQGPSRAPQAPPWRLDAPMRQAVTGREESAKA